MYDASDINFCKLRLHPETPFACVSYQFFSTAAMTAEIESFPSLMSSLCKHFNQLLELNVGTSVPKTLLKE